MNQEKCNFSMKSRVTVDTCQNLTAEIMDDNFNEIYVGGRHLTGAEQAETSPKIFGGATARQFFLGRGAGHFLFS